MAQLAGIPIRRVYAIHIHQVCADIHPLASVMGIYPHISEAAAAMVESLMQGVLFNTSPLVCVGSLLLIGAIFAAASVVALKKQSY